MSKDKLPKENFSPELRECMAEIENSLRKFNCMGLIVLQSEKHAEFKLCITEEYASWSIFEWKPRVDGQAAINMKFRKANHEAGEFSTGAAWSFRKITKMFALFFDSLANKIESQIQVDHTSGPIHNEGRE